MITREEAERISAVWAHRESLRRGYECAPMVDEFELGYIVWSAPPPSVATLPGDIGRTVIDKQTGEVTSWAALPGPLIAQMYRDYRAARPDVVHTMDLAAELRRNTTRLPTPNVAAHLTLHGRMFRAHGAKSDAPLRHHPLVREYLDQLPAGHLVRGGDRHAELIVLSDVLHEYDRQNALSGAPPLTLETARQLLAEAHLEVFLVREVGDPAGGPTPRGCESCINAMVHFGVLDWPELAWTEEWRVPPQPAPEPDRFPPEVAHALVDGGWTLPDLSHEVAVSHIVNEVLSVSGLTHRHQSFPAAEQTIYAFPWLHTRRSGPGEHVWIRPIRIAPARVAHTADTLGDFAAVIGARLFPLGTEGDDALLAVDEHGRIFALDQAGEWFLGATIDEALTNLLLGRAVPKVGSDGTW